MLDFDWSWDHPTLKKNDIGLDTKHCKQTADIRTVLQIYLNFICGF